MHTCCLSLHSTWLLSDVRLIWLQFLVEFCIDIIIECHIHIAHSESKFAFKNEYKNTTDDNNSILINNYLMFIHCLSVPVRILIELISLNYMRCPPLSVPIKEQMVRWPLFHREKKNDHKPNTWLANLYLIGHELIIIVIQLQKRKKTIENMLLQQTKSTISSLNFCPSSCMISDKSKRMRRGGERVQWTKDSMRDPVSGIRFASHSYANWKNEFCEWPKCRTTESN